MLGRPKLPSLSVPTPRCSRAALLVLLPRRRRVPVITLQVHGEHGENFTSHRRLATVRSPAFLCSVRLRPVWRGPTVDRRDKALAKRPNTLVDTSRAEPSWRRANSPRSVWRAATVQAAPLLTSSRRRQHCQRDRSARIEDRSVPVGLPENHSCKPCTCSPRLGATRRLPAGLPGTLFRETQWCGRPRRDDQF